MAGKALNKANLMALSPDTLAELLLEAVKGDAARQRRVRMVLAATQGPETVAVDVRKRFASIRRGRSFISRKSQKKLAVELSDLIRLIETRIAPDAPDKAFDLLWAQLHLAAGIHERTDDSWGAIGDTMRDAMEAIGRIAPLFTTDPDVLADEIFETMTEDGYGAFDHAIHALAPVLGDGGLEVLKARAEITREAPLTAADFANYDYISDPSEREARARQARNRSLEIILQDVADLQGDVDTWLAQYTPEQLTFHSIAPAAAARLLEAGRAKEALMLIRTAMEASTTDWIDPRDMDDMHFACLEALGRTEDLLAALWQRFETRLCPDALRHHLKMLPDFDDIEAEDAARQVVLGFDPVGAALGYCLAVGDMSLAAQVIDRRHGEIDGDAYEILTPMAEALAPERPLSAVLLWRAMIGFALTRQRKGRYGHAARHMQACAEADMRITDYGPHLAHADYVDQLTQEHARKVSFWNSVLIRGN
jgi:CBS domain-containing protein